MDAPSSRPTIRVVTPVAPVAGPLVSDAPSRIARVWANEGGDKVTQDELRASSDPNAVLNGVWDGTGISLFGAKNEVVAFNLVLESPETDATAVTVSLTELTGPDGASITAGPAAGDDLFDYVGRSIELFFVLYLEVKGLSVDLAYETYDERHIPERCRRPLDSDGEWAGGWADRPCHDKFYPDIAVPIELHTPFDVAAGTNQSIWGDIFIPKNATAGTYAGTINVTEDGVPTWAVPIQLVVRDFALPDLPNARTMLFFNSVDVNDRYLGEEQRYLDSGAVAYERSLQLADRHFQLAHRHKISLIVEDNEQVEIERMGDAWVDRLNGDLFTPARGYDGVGIGVGNNVYAIGIYGSWPWQDGSREDMWMNSDAWVNWFDTQQFATPTEYFLYLVDESDDYPQIEEWARWLNDNPGPGQRLMSMATIDLPVAAESALSLDIPTSLASFGIPEEWQSGVDSYLEDPAKRFFAYNGSRPASGTFAIEDDGVALRASAWAQFKMGIDRWFYWESTYYHNFQCLGEVDEAQTNVFEQAQTYGCWDVLDSELGQSGWNYFNGDGVLFYPGTDLRFPEDSYGVGGPFASLRLKLWRRGIQDVDYLVMAAAVDPVRTSEILQSVIPQVLWEYGVEDPEDPTWVLTDISWSTDPDTWEAARAELADIIEPQGP
jgi:hypothetical protein